MAIAGIIAAAALVMPYVVVPLRRALGLPTYQWDADVRTHPFLNNFGDNYRQHDFSDPALLNKWGHHGEYHYSGRLKPVTDRDFPEAVERLRGKGLLS